MEYYKENMSTLRVPSVDCASGDLHGLKAKHQASKTEISYWDKKRHASALRRIRQPPTAPLANRTPSGRGGRAGSVETCKVLEANQTAAESVSADSIQMSLSLSLTLLALTL